MTTYNTGNALGSSDPRDLNDNAINLDKAMNGGDDEWTDRLGVVRDAWAGLQKKFLDALNKMTQSGGILGFANEEALLAYTPDSANKIGMDTSTGMLYLWDGATWSKTGYQNSDIIDYFNNVIGSVSLATLADLTGSNYIVKTDGSRLTSTNWRNSTYIAVKAGQVLILTAANSNADYANIAFYDTDRNFLSADNVGAGTSVYKRVFVVPVDGYVILATRVATSSTFSCDVLKDVLTVDNKDKAGGYISYEYFKILTSGVSAGGEEVFNVSGYVSVASPASYPTASTTAHNSGYIPVNAGMLITANVAMSDVGYAIAFFSDQAASSFVEGVAGVNAAAISDYQYTAPTDGYVVLSLTTGALASAVTDSNYTLQLDLLKRSDLDTSLNTGIPSIKNLVENKVADVYYDDVNVKGTAVVTTGNYIGVNGAFVASTNHKLYAVDLKAGESIYAKANLNLQSATINRGIPVLSRYISAGVFEPLSFCFVSGAAYTEHLYTATQDCTIYVTSHVTETALPAVIRKRQYAVGSLVKQYPYEAAAWKFGYVHSTTTPGRIASNASYMTTPLIPVKAGDVVKFKGVINSSLGVGATVYAGAKYNKVGKYLGVTLQAIYEANTVYAFASMLVTEDGFISANNYTATGLETPEIIIFSPHENVDYFVKAPASNPYGDIYPGYAYSETGEMVPIPSAVTYLFDKEEVPKEATITLSYAVGTTYKYIAKLDANRAVLSVVTMATGIATLSLLDLFDSDDVEFVGITHASDGYDDSTSVNFLVNGRKVAPNFFELSEPVYNLYELAGRPDKTLSYNYTPLLQKLCLQMERQRRGKVYMESGLYKIERCFIKSFNHIYGDGMYNTIISGNDVPFINEKLSTKVYQKVTLTDLGFNLDLLTNRAGRGINMEYVKDLTCRNIWINKSAITGFGVDMWTGVLDNIVTEGCGQNQQDGSCAGMGIGVGALLEGQEHMLIVNCVNRNNFGHGMFFEWHNHTESSGETVIGDFPVGIQVVNCYSEGNAVGFGVSGGNAVSFSNCTAFRNLNGFAADNGSQLAGIRYGKNAMFSNCTAIENGSSLIQNPYFTPRQMRFGNGNGFAIYKTADYTDPAIGDNARGYFFNNCVSEENEAYGLRVTAASNISTPVMDVSVNGGTYSRNGNSGIQVQAATENLMIRGAMLLNNAQNGFGVSFQITDAIIKDNIVKGNAKGLTASNAAFVDSSIIKDNIVKGNTVDLENVTNS